VGGNERGKLGGKRREEERIGDLIWLETFLFSESAEKEKMICLKKGRKGKKKVLRGLNIDEQAGSPKRGGEKKKII